MFRKGKNSEHILCRSISKNSFPKYYMCYNKFKSMFGSTLSN